MNQESLVRAVLLGAIVFEQQPWSVISSKDEGAIATEDAVEKSRGCILCHADTGCSPKTACATLLFVRDGFHYKFWVYILSSRSGTLYVGITGFFDKRLDQHKCDSIEGFTKKYQCHRLVYYESYQDVQVVISREKQIKRWGREKKIALECGVRARPACAPSPLHREQMDDVRRHPL